MGVQGFTRLLMNKGILSSTPSECCTVDLWRKAEANIQCNDDDADDNGASDGDEPSIRNVLPGSMMLIDGPGLAFYLHSIAYSRWARRVTERQPKQRTCLDTVKLKAQQITLLLPHNMPLQVLVDLTTEFVSYLRDTHCLQLQVHWDGPSSTEPPIDFKATTLKKRRERREMEWSNLQRYCNHGMVPNDEGAKQSCQLCHEFPTPGMFLMVVRQTLEQLAVPNIVCDGEADPAMAKKACRRPDVYVVGQDSDFFFYRGIQYIPFNGFFQTATGQSKSPSKAAPLLRAHVYMRQEIAESLGLIDGLMTELAVMIGNDYVDATATLKAFEFDHDRLLTFLAAQEQGAYKHQSSTPSIEAAIQYSRVLYDHGCVEDLPMTGELESFDNNEDSEDEEMEMELGLSKRSRSLLSHVRLQPYDASIRRAWLRSLQWITDETAAEDSMTVVQAKHLKILQKPLLKRGLQNDLPKLERPKWEDVLAAELIERCALRLFKQNAESELVPSASPASLFDHAIFHHGMSSTRIGQPVGCGETETNPHNSPSQPPESGAQQLPPKPISLPIDEHRDSILESIRKYRVTIIHGETGCGKSSRVPVMLLDAPPPDPALAQVKLFVSQPRRIAAKALVERVRSCEPKHGNKFALRMGHGWREYESSATRAWFVTTGYLTRLLANHPEKFDGCTHLVIDEVHERSVDTDILCYLCRRLLNENKHIRLVLMSATLATKLYQAYFNLPNDQKILHVGVRKYPIQELYLEDLNRLQLSSKEKQAVAALTKECETKKCTTAPAQHAMKHLHTLAARLALLVADPGCAVLIFVPGMAEIIAITEAIEGIYVVGVRYTCFPIHSDIPFEDQLAAFDAPEADEVKIIIATPAAESSVTLPAVDHCIDLGLCRQIVYNAASHRQTLTPTWISRASAKQRAGRTGRLRPGTVYRLYTKKAYEQYMDEFEPGEMVRIPLDSVILMLKEMLNEKVTPVLLGCLEPPNTSTIDRSFESLHQWNFIESPTDDGKITVLGSFVSSLGMDLRFGALIGLGIQFGVAAEAVELATVMSFPKTPFQITSPLIHSPAEYNEISSITFMSRCHFDANLYSEPLGLMNLMWDYEKAQHKGRFCSNFRVAINRFRQLVSSKNNKRKRVAEFLGISEERLKTEAPPVHMHPSKVAILRTLQAWVFSDMIIEAKPVPINQTSDGAVMLNVSTNGRVLSSEDLLQVLDKHRHPHRIDVTQRIKQNGSFEPVVQPFKFRSFLPVFEERLVSYICVKEIDLAWFVDSNHLVIYIPERLTTKHEVMALLDVVVEGETWRDILAEEETTVKRRGISERTCGAWTLKDSSHYDGTSKGGQQKRFRRYEMPFHRSLKQILGEVALASRLVRSSLEWNFSEQNQQGKKKKKKEKRKKEKDIPSFFVTLNGSCSDISKVDLQDLLGTSAVSFTVSRNNSTQTLVFDPAPNRPITFKSTEDQLLATCSVTEASSWKNPLFVDIPEGARLLSVIASGQRRSGHKIVLQSKETANEDIANGESEEAKLGEFDLILGKETRISHRWKRLSGGGAVYVPEFSLPASATSPAHHLFACCANALEVAGGGLRVDCLSLLPPDPLLVAASFLSFGLQVPGAHLSSKCSETIAAEDGITAYSDDANACLHKSDLLQWIRARYHCDAAHTNDDNLLKFDERITMTKLRQAVSFHRSTATLGEALVCLPSSVKDLCNLLDGLGGQKVALWDDLPEKALTAENLTQWRKEKGAPLSSESNQPIPVGKRGDLPHTLKMATGSAAREHSEAKIDKEAKGSSEVVAPRTKKKNDGVRKGNKGDKISPKTPAILDLVPTSISTTKKPAPTACQLSHDVAKEYQDLFATKLPDGGKVTPDELASTNILALLMEECGSILMEQERAPKRKKGWSQWKVYKLNHADGIVLYRACFSSTLLPCLPIEGRGKNLLPKWMKRMTRPILKEDAPPCIPDVTRKASLEAHQAQSAGRMDVWFHSVDAALRMEAAFWLERQFCRANRRSDKTATFRHWYDHTFEEMMAIALGNPVDA